MQASLGVARAFDAHDVTWTPTVGDPATVTLPAQTYASPLEYLEAVAQALSVDIVLSATHPSFLRIVSLDRKIAGTLEVPLGPDEYTGADTGVLTIGADSLPTEWLWTGSLRRRPGLLPRHEGNVRYSRRGQTGTPGVLTHDTLGVWAMEGDADSIDPWYDFAFQLLSGNGAIEIRCDGTTEQWYVDSTEMALEEEDASGLYAYCDLPVLRRM